MSDIFDEVDEILKDVDLSSEEVPSEEIESNFNEAELQDIMAEIENLEKEFDTPEDTASFPSESAKEEVDFSGPIEATQEVAKQEQVTTSPEVSLPEKKLNLQDEIDRELEMSLEMNLQESVEAPKDLPVAEVLTFEKKIVPAPSTSIKSNSEISFEAIGQMNLNLGFKIGDESARLSIDPNIGLVVSMNGVELCINQEEGCVVTMENGVKFTIPLTSSDSALKKKSA